MDIETMDILWPTCLISAFAASLTYANENTISFVQKIYNSAGELIELHRKYPVDEGHIKTEKMISKQTIANQLLNYLNHRMNLAALVHWAEAQLMEGGFESGHEKIIRETLGRLAAADAEGFGLLWEECDKLMQGLGYKIKIDAAKVA